MKLSTAHMSSSFLGNATALFFFLPTHCFYSFHLLTCFLFFEVPYFDWGGGGGGGGEGVDHI